MRTPEMTCYVISLGTGGVAVFPLARQAEIACAFPANVVVAQVVVEGLRVRQDLVAVYPLASVSVVCGGPRSGRDGALWLLCLGDSLVDGWREGAGRLLDGGGGLGRRHEAGQEVVLCGVVETELGIEIAVECVLECAEGNERRKTTAVHFCLVYKPTPSGQGPIEIVFALASSWHSLLRLGTSRRLPAPCRHADVTCDIVVATVTADLRCLRLGARNNTD